MKTQTLIRRILMILVVCFACVAFASSRIRRRFQSPREEAEGYYWYENILLPQEEVKAVFNAVNDSYPNYVYLPEFYHVTSEFKPEIRHERLYGTSVTVHIIGYASGSVNDVNGKYVSDNEGLLVEVSSENKDMQRLLDSYDRVWHITGSYSGAAMYTEQLDYSSLIPLDITVEGMFVSADSEGIVTPAAALTAVRVPGS